MSKLEIKYVSPDSLLPASYNPRKMTEKQVKDLSDSASRFGLVDPLIVNSNKDRKNIVIGGHQRLAIAKRIGLTEVPVVFIDLSLDKERELNLRLNKNNGEWDWDELANFDPELLKEVGFTDAEIASFDYGANKNALATDFLIPPFSVWDTRQGYWQDRKRIWKSIIGDSRVGASTGSNLTGTSEFDPVVAEVSYKWFCPTGGSILDPFAGGSVRGLVALQAGYAYTGIDLSSRQVETNRASAERLNLAPNWIVGNSINIQTLAKNDTGYDLMFSCPPYFNLEEYSDDKDDLSNLSSYDSFVEQYSTIIAHTSKLIKENRFAVFVVSQIRDEKGYYRDFVGDTIRAFVSAGWNLYNDIILVNALGTAPVRARRYFSNRKVAKTHQNVLVFQNFKNDVSTLKRAHDNILVFHKGEVSDIQATFGEMPVDDLIVSNE